MLKQRSQNGSLSLWKNVGSSNGLWQPCTTINTDQNTLETKNGGGKPYRANEALPTPLAAECLDSSHPVSNALLALLTLWHPQPHMAVLAIRVALVYCESYIRIFECSVSCEAPVP